MKLRSVTIKNFRSIFADEDKRPLKLDFSDGANFLVGPNNAGKSNVLRAVGLALDPSYFRLNCRCRGCDRVRTPPSAVRCLAV
jgi:predicted ATP-dependent endonuclease of OLD family